MISSSRSSTPTTATGCSRRTSCALTEDDSVWVSEYRVIAADGRTVWVRDESWTVTDEEGTPQFVQGCMIDVTEQKQAQLELAAASDALRQAEQQSRRLIEELPMAVYTDKPDTTSTSIYISPRVERCSATRGRPG